MKVFGEMYKRGISTRPQARLLVPPRRDRPGGGRDRVPGRPLHHGVCEVPLHDDLRKLDGMTRARFLCDLDHHHLDPAGNLAIALHPRELCPGAEPQRGDLHPGRGLVKKVMEVGGVEGYTVRWQPIPGPSLRICWRTTPSCPRPPAGAGGLCHHGLRYRLRPHRSRLRRGRLRDLQAVRDGHGGTLWTTRAATPITPASTRG